MRNTILPSVYDFLIREIKTQLLNSISITLIADLWTNTFREDFMGLAACITMPLSKERKLIVIGFEKMEDTNHTAEKIKFKIDKILSQFDLDKKKIIGK